MVSTCQMPTKTPAADQRRPEQRTRPPPADLDQQRQRAGQEQGIDDLHQGQAAELKKAVIDELTKPVDVLKRFAEHRESE